MKTALSLSLALLVAPVALFAQAPTRTPLAVPPPDVPARLDLRTAVAYVVENNFAIRQARERIKEQEGLIVEVRARESGHLPAFQAVRGAVAAALRQQSFATALRQYLSLLAGQAAVEGVSLDTADTLLVQ
jgi:hypothetical protein